MSDKATILASVICIIWKCIFNVLLHYLFPSLPLFIYALLQYAMFGLCMYFSLNNHMIKRYKISSRIILSGRKNLQELRVSWTLSIVELSSFLHCRINLYTTSAPLPAFIVSSIMHAHTNRMLELWVYVLRFSLCIICIYICIYIVHIWEFPIHMFIFFFLHTISTLSALFSFILVTFSSLNNILLLWLKSQVEWAKCSQYRWELLDCTNRKHDSVKKKK